VPAWAALALIVSQPLHLIFAVVVPNGLLDAFVTGNGGDRSPRRHSELPTDPIGRVPSSGVTVWVTGRS